MVYLIRHTTPAVTPGTCYGRLELPLAQSSIWEIEAVLQRVPPITTIWTSPAERCRRLARALAVYRGARLQEDRRLLELDFGSWEGLRWSEVPRDEIDAWAADLWRYAPGGGESLAMLWRRVTAFAEDVNLRAAQRAPEGTLVVTHHGPLRVLHCIGRHLEAGRFFETHFGFGADGLRAWLVD